MRETRTFNGVLIRITVTTDDPARWDSIFRALPVLDAVVVVLLAIAVITAIITIAEVFIGF